ncbi:coenzyme F420-0:L-glutamate ligase, partial [Brevibacterium aurantiacum]|uniref:coenzyme F420-0:L-glutamate ligase n=2 Tax=Micrococcales TaxID=85006 RepID=UPI003F9733D8
MQVGALEGIPEVVEGSDLPRMILDAIDTAGDQLIDGDILVVTSKIISKAEGRSVRAEDREDAITAETIRVVATRARADGGVTRIVQNRLGIVGAAAGVDASNTEPGTILLLLGRPLHSVRTLCESSVSI